jgi:signal transduction histidine kinase
VRTVVTLMARSERGLAQEDGVVVAAGADLETDGDAGISADADAATYTKAILNILDDFGEERERQAESQRALINMLEDIDSERSRLGATQSAILNILDDFDAERRKVEEANRDLEAVNEAMRGFVAVAAHDLRSPLASIVGFSALLNESWGTLTDETRRKFVSTIERQSNNLAKLVDDLLTLSSAEGGSMTTRPEMVVLAEAINRCLESGSGDTSNVTVSCSPDLVVRVDPDHLARILDNYVQNALKYGGPPVQIEAARLGHMVEIRVKDHGLGVPPDFVSRLFGKFARANTPGDRAQKGTGLGLSIVSALAEVNGGQACYEANVPSGACFVVRLPLGAEARG